MGSPKATATGDPQCLPGRGTNIADWDQGWRIDEGLSCACCLAEPIPWALFGRRQAWEKAIQSAPAATRWIYHRTLGWTGAAPKRAREFIRSLYRAQKHRTATVITVSVRGAKNKITSRCVRSPYRLTGVAATVDGGVEVGL